MGGVLFPFSLKKEFSISKLNIFALVCTVFGYTGKLILSTNMKATFEVGYAFSLPTYVIDSCEAS